MKGFGEDFGDPSQFLSMESLAAFQGAARRLATSHILEESALRSCITRRTELSNGSPSLPPVGVLTPNNSSATMEYGQGKGDNLKIMAFTEITKKTTAKMLSLPSALRNSSTTLIVPKKGDENVRFIISSDAESSRDFSQRNRARTAQLPIHVQKDQRLVEIRTPELPESSNILSSSKQGYDRKVTTGASYPSTHLLEIFAAQRKPRDIQMAPHQLFLFRSRVPMVASGTNSLSLYDLLENHSLRLS